MAVQKNDKGTLDRVTFPGGYSILYLMGDCAVLCAACANGENDSDATTDLITVDADGDSSPTDLQWLLCDAFIHWEGEPITCDHCNVEQASEYGPIEDHADLNLND